jgi:diacylglycerol kinase family enzyme
MTEAVDVLHAMERLLALANAGPGSDAEALKEVNAVLFRMGLGNRATCFGTSSICGRRWPETARGRTETGLPQHPASSGVWQ